MKKTGRIPGVWYAARLGGGRRPWGKDAPLEIDPAYHQGVLVAIPRGVEVSQPGGKVSGGKLLARRSAPVGVGGDGMK